MQLSTLLLFLAAVSVFVIALMAAWRESVALTNPSDYRHPRPAGFHYTVTPLSAYGLPYDDMVIQASPASSIRGWLVPAPGGKRELAVVAIHGRGGDRESHMSHLPLLHDAGAAVALIDLRENGLSDGNGRGTALGMREAEDALAVAEELRRRGYRKVVLFGCSLGASAALIAAARDPNIAGVIAESPLESISAYVRDAAVNRLRRHGLDLPWIASSWAGIVVWITRVRLGLRNLDNPVDTIEAIAPRPILIIQGARDQTAPLAHAQRMAMRAGPNARLLTIPEGGHCDGFAIAPAPYAEQVRRLLESVSAQAPNER